MAEDRTVETAEIKLDVSKLLGFQMLATLGEGAEDLRRAMEDTHNKIGVGEAIITRPASEL